MLASLTNRPLHVLLIRHASVHDGERRLWGRTSGVGLSDEGVCEAAALADALAKVPLDAIYASPRERTWQTAMLIAAHRSLEITAAAAFDEVDCGAWTGKTFTDLEADAEWRAYNDSRATAAVPGGESARGLFARVNRGLLSIEHDHLGGIVAIVTHAEVIRAVVLDALGWSPDQWASVRVDRASTTVVRRRHDVGTVHAINLSPQTFRLWNGLAWSQPPKRHKHLIPRSY